MISDHFNNSKNHRTELSNEELRMQAPAIFAAQPIQGVTERYTFLPTAVIVDE